MSSAHSIGSNTAVCAEGIDRGQWTEAQREKASKTGDFPARRHHDLIMLAMPRAIGLPQPRERRWL